MRLGNCRNLLGGLVVGAFALSLMVSEAQAGWWHRAAAYCGSSGGYSSYGSYGSSGSSGGSWGSSGSHGSCGYVRHHHRPRHYWYSHSSGSCGSYGSYGSCGSSGSYGSYSSGSWGSSGGSSGGAVYYGTPTYSDPSPAIEYSNPMPATPPSLPVPPGQSTSLSGDATLTVNVPAAAKIYVNGRPTTSEGDLRRYVSRGLSTGYDYTYELRAELERDGRVVEETKVVSLRGGQTLHVDFEFRAEASAVTSLTVNVPDDAKVYLAGVETTATGKVRTFNTTKLTPGTSWSDYVVKVELNREGRTIVEEKSITLNAGETKELDFNSEASYIASTR